MTEVETLARLKLNTAGENSSSIADCFFCGIYVKIAAFQFSELQYYFCYITGLDVFIATVLDLNSMGICLTKKMCYAVCRI